jgi:serine/threonine-protein kinase
MGEAFVALDASGQPCVVKRILTEFVGDDGYQDMFLAEGRLVRAVRHPNVVGLHDMGEVDGRLYIAMEFVPGVPLKDLLDVLRREAKRLPPRLAVDIAIQLLDGLHAAHRAVDSKGRRMGIVHRDVNPMNVLLDFKGRVKLIDFGIAKSEIALLETASGTIKGKFLYMSPEQSAAEPLDHRSDLFSVGILLYEMLTLSNPFARPNVVLALEAIQLGPTPELGTQLPALAPLDQVLAPALAKEPSQRFSDAAGMADALRGAEPELRPPPQGLTEILEHFFGDRRAHWANLLGAQRLEAVLSAPPPATAPASWPAVAPLSSSTALPSGASAASPNGSAPDGPAPGDPRSGPAPDDPRLGAAPGAPAAAEAAEEGTGTSRPPEGSDAPEDGESASPSTVASVGRPPRDQVWVDLRHRVPRRPSRSTSSVSTPSAPPPSPPAPPRALWVLGYVAMLVVVGAMGFWVTAWVIAGGWLG